MRDAEDVRQLKDVLHFATRSAAKRDAYRARVLCLVGDGMSRTQIRAAAPIELEYLTDHDRDWLNAALPGRRRKPQTPRGVVHRDWAARDIRLSQQVEEAGRSLRAKRARRRITPTRILSRVDSVGVYFGNPDKYPLTRQALERHAESQFQFQRRIISDALEGFRSHLEGVTQNMLRRATWLPPRILKLHSSFIVDRAQILGVGIKARALASFSSSASA